VKNKFHEYICAEGMSKNMKISAKYNMLHQPLIERIVAEESGKKNPLKAAKTKLHQLYGAYSQSNAHKKAAQAMELLTPQQSFALQNFATPLGKGVTPPSQTNNLIGGVIQSPDASDWCRCILGLHMSTKERLPYLAEFYKFIAKYTGTAKTILDLGCGFNPFSIPFMPDELKNLETYHAYDIDLRTMELLNNFFALMGLPQGAKCADLIAEIPAEEVDIALMLKILPVLEAQSPGCGFCLANNVLAKYLVISYPLQSLGGREKGMAKNYADTFKNAVESGKLSAFNLIATENLPRELVYVLKKRESRVQK